MKSNITAGILDKYEDISCPQSIKEYYDRLFFIKRETIEGKTITHNCSDIYSGCLSRF